MFDKLMRGKHYNEGTMMQHVIFPPAGLEIFTQSPVISMGKNTK
jgi:hypothetical protein